MIYAIAEETELVKDRLMFVKLINLIQEENYISVGTFKIK